MLFQLKLEAICLSTKGGKNYPFPEKLKDSIRYHLFNEISNLIENY